MENPFVIPKKSLNLSFTAIVASTVSILAVIVIIYGGLAMGALLIVAPFVLWVVVSIFKDPRVGMLTLFCVNYFVMGVSRYLPGPLGLLIDGVLVLTYISVFIKSVTHNGIFKQANRDLTYLAVIWYLYAIFELFNPEAQSREAWFFAMRGFSLYFLMVIPLTFILLNRRRDLDMILKLFSIFTLLAVAKGLIQNLGYLDSFEKLWLAEGGAKTHIVAGKLRVFSFFTDAGQYGASMGYSGVVFLISSIGLTNKRAKYYYIFVALMAFVGMMISGTRGAISVPLAALFLFMIISGNAKYLIITGVVLVSLFGFFKYTNIGNDNYEIRRMRTAFSGTRDASFAVRLENQTKLAQYLKTRPFGGGIGSAGNWGQRFSPNSFLAGVPTDSWYVSIWADQGIVGLTLHLLILCYVLIKGSILVRRVKNRQLSFKLKGFLCGFAGVMLASYTNGVMGQVPTGIIVYMSMAFIFMSKELDNELVQ